MAARYEWDHTDPRGLSAAIPAAIARAVSKDWGTPLSTTDATADYRALFAASVYMMDELSKRPAELGPGSVTMSDRTFDETDFTSEARAQAARILIATFALQVRRLGVVTLPTYEAVATVGGLAPVPIPRPGVETAGWVIPAVAIVVGSAVVVFLIQKSAEVVDRQNARDEDTKRLLEYHGRVLDVLERHRTDEKEKGREVPFSDAEVATVNALQNVQTEYAKASGLPPLSSPIPSGTSIGLGLGLGGLAIVGVLVYFLFAKGK
jgi:hypothetical protein